MLDASRKFSKLISQFIIIIHKHHRASQCPELLCITFNKGSIYHDIIIQRYCNGKEHTSTPIQTQSHQIYTIKNYIYK